MFEKLDNVINTLSRFLAILGGVVLLVTVVVTCLSITGRTLDSLGLSQITGDFEIVEIGVGFAIFAFLPYTQYRSAHAQVDLFKASFPNGFNRLLNVIADLLMLTIAVVLAHRLWLGTLDKQSYAETTFILQFPIWIAYAAACIAMVGFILTAAFCVLRSTRKLVGVK